MTVKTMFTVGGQLKIAVVFPVYTVQWHRGNCQRLAQVCRGISTGQITVSLKIARDWLKTGVLSVPNKVHCQYLVEQCTYQQSTVVHDRQCMLSLAV